MPTLSGTGQETAGPYRIVAELGSAPAAESGPRCVLARDQHSGRAAVVVLPPERLAADPGFRMRLWAEARNAARLPGPCPAPVAAIAPPDSGAAWVAYDCAPALPLPGALAVNGGPLPVACVLALGLALAESMLAAHALGLVHAGISPGSVLLTPSGPRLVGYGFTRAAQPGAAAPTPLDDVRALAAVLCYAASGTESPGDALPQPLHDVLTPILAARPEAVPQADALVAELRRHTQGASGWPAPVDQALAGQLGPEFATAVPDRPAPPGQPPDTAVPGRIPPSRRALLTGLAFGAAGLAVGGGGVTAWLKATEKEPKVHRTTAAPGAPPRPLWHYGLDGGRLSGAYVVGENIAVLSADIGTIGVDIRTGKKLWAREDMSVGARPTVVGKLMMTDDLGELVFVDPRTAKRKFQLTEYGIEGRTRFKYAIAGAGSTLWFMATVGEGSGGADQHAVVAYDTVKRRELWVEKLPKGYGAILSPDEGDGEGDGTISKLRGKTLLIPSQADGAGEFGYLALDPRTGKKLWHRVFPVKDMPEYLGPESFTTPDGVLISPQKENDKMVAFELRTGRKLWTRPLKSVITLGAPDVRRRVVHGVYGDYAAAFDTRTGKRRWAARIASPVGLATNVLLLSHARKTLLYRVDSGFEAFDVRDGSHRWRFATVDGGEMPGETGTMVGVAPGRALFSSELGLYALPVD
ncbi:PQQ-binding-like beta-propeller repeat protein [Streptomyces sp. A7024]|uniref:PQQ-binding-like beta-propeller repeat protein n=1 Tax=Streptomyces coryli TaxID=1128680 RepID=A0A6G4U742_9ACTN|nr:PQQ-binding-like beta-propeller repeat protein [Streptomyces coryli]NGN67208.1 PQQ-binding-like beta-propeller repeat protein [Streptomyces coryli]